MAYPGTREAFNTRPFAKAAKGRGTPALPSDVNSSAERLSHLRKINVQQKRIIRRSGLLVQDFILEEWGRAAFGSLAGIVAAILKHLLSNDAVFHAKVVCKWEDLPIRFAFAGFEAYRSSLQAIAILALVITGFLFLRFAFRLVRSFAHGIISGLTGLWALSFFVFFGIKAPTALPYAIAGAIALAILFSIASFGLRLLQLLSDAKAPASIDFSIPKSRNFIRPEERWAEFTADSPIEDWNQDLLNRSALIESLATKLIVSKLPVIALRGAYGDGKSSVLNLLRKTLNEHAIVIPFSTWLPGSEKTLATDLFSDIATACKKRFYVPQLRRRLLAYAKTVGGVVPHLGSLTELFPQPSQREEIDEITKILSRIPRRIVVLLDEVDRLEEEELRVLLKIIRGVAFLPRLSYVCAFNRSAVENALFGRDDATTHEYLEKFFPNVVEVPKADSALLFELFQSGLSRTFEDLQWFEATEQRKRFLDDIKNLWDQTLVHFYTNLRRIVLILNDVASSARPIAREVNPSDLVTLETLRRFFPTLYEELWRNEEMFVYGQFSWTKKPYRSEKDIRTDRETYFQQLKDRIGVMEHSAVIGGLLAALSPAYAAFLDGNFSVFLREGTDDTSKAESEKRIFHPDFFPIYFRYQVPETMFSERALQRFVEGMNASDTREQTEALFRATLAEMPRGSPRRYNFLHRLAFSVDRLKEASAESLVYALARNAADYTYEILNMGEASRAIAAIFEVANRFSKTTKIQDILEMAISTASDDTLALRLLDFSTTRQSANQIVKDFTNVSKDEIKEAFVRRMNNRYGLEANVRDVSITQGDRDAFTVWAQNSPEDRRTEIEFWRRFVGGNRKRLAQAVAFLFPGNVVWETDPAPFIEILFPMDDLRTLFAELPVQEELDESETKALERLRKLINAEFRLGFPEE